MKKQIDTELHSLGDFTAALEALPLFPLPDVILMPGAVLPLHVFEPRYRKMVRDILGSHRTLGLVQIKNAKNVDANGNPEIATVAGVGTIIEHAELPSGRFNIVVRGRARVRLEELPFVTPYRRAAATVMPSVDETVSQETLAALVSAATAFVSTVRRKGGSFELSPTETQSPGAIADHFAQTLVLDPRIRQEVLETASVKTRMGIVTRTLAIQSSDLSEKTGMLN